MNNEHFYPYNEYDIFRVNFKLFFKIVNFYSNNSNEHIVWENASTIFHSFSLMISHEKHTSQKAHKKCLHLDRISLFIPHIFL